jgi:hypothetical protein
MRWHRVYGSLRAGEAFPKVYIRDAKKLAQESMSSRMIGKMTCFRVVASGLGCIPDLEIRECTISGQTTARWTVYQETEEKAMGRGEVVGRTTPIGGQRADGEGEWQVASGDRRTVVVAHETAVYKSAKNKGTLRKLVHRQVVCAPARDLPSPGEEDKMEADNPISLKVMWSHT